MPSLNAQQNEPAIGRKTTQLLLSRNNYAYNIKEINIHNHQYVLKIIILILTRAGKNQIFNGKFNKINNELMLKYDKHTKKVSLNELVYNLGCKFFY